MPREPRPTISLPFGGRDLVDHHLLRVAVEEINAMTLRDGLEGVVALGRWVLETFFGGDSERFEVERGSQPTWRALGRHPALGVSTTELWYAVRIVEQLDELPRRIGRALTPSHHRLLLTVEERRTKRRLARAAVEGGWGVRELAAEIGALSPATPQGEVAGVRLGRRVRSLHREALAFEAVSLTAHAGSLRRRRRERLEARARSSRLAMIALLARLDALGPR